MIKKILVANRGEIAVRVLKSARKLNIKTVAVYSDADRNAPFVKMADEAVNIGPPPSSESYLRGDKIIEVALKCNVDAIHPGYGFLSENGDFAEKVEAAGIIFIGPSSEAIEIMGSKLKAKETVKQYDIPLVPGTDKAVTDPEKAASIAEDIGFPVLIKASAGGGGKGMRIVKKKSEFKEQLERAISEALNAFGDQSVFIEKYVDQPRHIEIQILADKHGNVVHLGERECSIQRRHQKVIEEAPSSILNENLRNTMGEAAKDVARACDYVGAGTVEFLMDGEKNFYFLEMNTRLQVEHPVTEFITGIDLVEQQISIAEGNPLEFTQEDISFTGHSIELRVYAEDPLDNFLPSIGTLERYQLPAIKNVRVDNGYEEGQVVPIYYDPLLAKLVVYAEDRTQAIHKMKHAIGNYLVTGISTSLPFGKYVMEHPAFISGEFTTQFVDKHFSKEKFIESRKGEMEIAALASFYTLMKDKKKVHLPEGGDTEWRVNRKF